MKKSYFIVAVSLAILLVGICMSLIRRNWLLTRELDMLHSAMSLSGSRDVEIDYLEESFELSLENNHSLYDLIADSANFPVSLLSLPITEKNPRLVYYYDQSQCQECIIFGMNKLKLFVERTGIQPLLLTHYTDTRTLQEVNRLLDVLSFPSCNLPFRINIEVSDTPFFFIILDDKNIQAVFVPEKGLPKITDRYLKTIGNVYWNRI